MFLIAGDYLKKAIPSQLISERGSKLVVINPGTPPTCSTFKGSANIGAGLAQQDAPFVVSYCIARYTSQLPKPNVQDQVV
ncbi:actin-related protein 9-like [Eucalyptus grandis]|uniref:actin-related protein 9-like n=1 Tax=Eucalyptus grandis TaxID=71139 RepID=UPI00192EDBD5|nr:actin-related protein 9-like [Eucalyptus grandis]